MDFRVSVLFLMTTIFLGFWLLILLKGPRQILNRVYSIFVINMALWSFGLGMFYKSQSPEASLFWANVLYLSGSLIPAAFLHFSFVFPSGKMSISHFKQFLIYVPNIILFYLFFFTPIIVKGITPPGQPKGFIYGPGHILWDLQFDTIFAWAFVRLCMAYKRHTGIVKMRLRYVILGTLTGVILAGITNVIMPWFNRFELLWLAPSLTLTWLGCITYAIVKYRLMDINVALTRVGIFGIVYTLVLGIPFWVGFRFLGKGLWMLPVSIMAVFATLGPFIFMYLRQRAESILLKDQHRYQGILGKLSATLTLVKDLNRLLTLVVLRGARAVKVDFACVYLAEKDTKLIQKYPYTIKGFFPDFPKELSFDSSLVRYIISKRKPIFAEEVSTFSDGFNLKTGLIVPSFVRKRLLGFLLLGPKASGAIYTQEDANMFGILTNQLALAIENSQFIDEHERTQAELFSRERMASLGTMAGGMTHQINNRFNAITMATSDTIDTLKFIDLENNSKDELKDYLQQIKHALARIQENALRGGKLVNDFLNFSQPDRLQKEAKLFNLPEPLERGIEMARIKTAFPDDTIEKHFQEGRLLVKGSFVMIQDAFFNINDNAIDALDKKGKAIKNKELTLPEGGYKGKVAIRMYREDPWVVSKIHDNGIGMTKEQIEKIFTPFFTTKATAVKGTGLGLFVIWKIVEYHKGTIEVESEYGKGTTFTIKLPLAKEGEEDHEP